MKTLESPLDCKEIQPVHPKGDQSWVLIGRTDIEAETPKLWPPDAKSWLICWERLREGGEGDDRGLQIQWTWVWVDSGSWWWTGRPGMLRFVGLQKVGHDWAAELNWTESRIVFLQRKYYLSASFESILQNSLNKDVFVYIHVCVSKRRSLTINFWMPPWILLSF